MYGYNTHDNYVDVPRVDMLTTQQTQLKGHLRGATPGTECIYNTLADEEANRNADRYLDHAQAECKAAVVLLYGAVVVSSETTSLGETRLGQHSGYSQLRSFFYINVINAPAQGRELR